jgi:hypothetical protein
MDHDTLRRAGAVLLAAAGALHLVLAPEYLGEKAYIGVLFILGGATALLLAARLWRRDDRIAAALGSLIAIGMAAGFVLSRTVGLPGFHESEWELSGVLSVLIELGFVGTLAWRAATPRPQLSAAR